MVICASIWCMLLYLVLLSCSWFYVGLFGIMWFYSVSLSAVWFCLVQLLFLIYPHLLPCGAMKFYLAPIGSSSFNVVLFDIMWFYLLLFGPSPMWCY